MMKLIRAGIMSAVMVVMMCGGVFAQGTFVPQGSAIVPGVESGFISSKSNWATYMALTNITNDVVVCRVLVYDQNGNDVTYHTKVMTGSTSSGWVVIASGSSDFEIPAHSTRKFVLQTLGSKEVIIGHATIQWSSNDPLPHNALIGAARTAGYVDSKIFATNIPINNGQPF
ncbi:hypothetical protein [Maridesulfovibrio sp.]|uniref:hypothetical protein n=1 Tax=Maridesulfovibrio sp. TaxID=2795000 RepID=UPI002A18CDBC|nr:hypothetical protein [Maridesulfovibrio sp.]